MRVSLPKDAGRQLSVEWPLGFGIPLGWVLGELLSSSGGDGSTVRAWARAFVQRGLSRTCLGARLGSRGGIGQGAWGSRGRSMLLSSAARMRRGSPSTDRVNAEHRMLLFLSPRWVCSSLHVSGLPKGSQRGWLEHVVQLGWVKNRMCSRLCAVLSVAVPPAEPCKKLQARFPLPSFLPAVSAHTAAIIGGVQHAEPSASKLFKAPPASCTPLHTVDTWFPGWDPSPPRPPRLLPSIPFHFSSSVSLGWAKGGVFSPSDTGTPLEPIEPLCSRSFPLRNPWPLSLAGLLC